jgi:hypothetical protein
MTQDSVLPREGDRRRRRAGWWLAAGAVLLLVAIGVAWAAHRGPGEGPDPQAGPTATPTGSPSPTSSHSQSPTGSPSSTTTPTGEPSETTEPTASSSGSATPSPTNPATALTLRASSGSGQSSDVRAAYTLPLVARVTAPTGAPVAGVLVAFSAPGSGASGTFDTGGCSLGSSPTRCVALSNGDGIATTSALRANTTPGAFTVSARVIDGTSSIGFSLTNGIPFAVTLGSVSPQLYPGATASPIPVRISNPNPFPISVVSLVIAAHNASCNPTTNLVLRQVDLATATHPGRIVVPAHGTVTLPAQGVGSPTIAMLDLPYDQTPSCAGQTFTLTSTGIAQP